MTYKINYTDSRKTPFTLDEDALDYSLGFYLFGQNRLAYGQEMQENLLHLLESFCAPESSTVPDTPDTSKVIDSVLSTPIEGHLWYNSTKNVLCFYDGTAWQPVSQEGDIAANWGTIMDGETIPKPISAVTGKVFDYTECVWIISPVSMPSIVDGLVCDTDSNAVVNMKYIVGGNQISAYANYMIVGITGNINHNNIT